MKECKICGKEYYARNYCRKHYNSLFLYKWISEYRKAWRKNHYPYKKHACFVNGCKAHTSGKYCYAHKERIRRNLPLDLLVDGRSIRMGGENNLNWRGGISEYPNHYLMKKNRLIILIHNPICEICKKKPAIEIHHKNGNKADHRLSNLQASCHKCNANIRFHPNKSKYRRLYGMNLREISNGLCTSYGTIYGWQRKGILESILKSNNTTELVGKVLDKFVIL